MKTKAEELQALSDKDGMIIELIYFVLRSVGEPQTVNALFGFEPRLGRISTIASVAQRMRQWTTYSVVPLGIHTKSTAGNTIGLKRWALPPSTQAKLLVPDDL